MSNLNTSSSPKRKFIEIEEDSQHAVIENAPSTIGESHGVMPTADNVHSHVPPVTSEPNGNSEAAETKNRKLTSEVWNHFKKQKIEGLDKAVCNYCKKKLSATSKNGTRHLHDHIKICKLRTHRDIRQSILNPRNEKKDGSIKLEAHTFDQQVSRTELAKMIILKLVLMIVWILGRIMICLEESVLPRSREFDILSWWKANGLRYPTLQQVVKDVLAVPVSTVASESAFGAGGRHVTPHRNRLHPDTLEALICFQDWLWDDKLGTNSSRENYLAMFEDIKDDDEVGPSFVDFDS